MLVSKRPHQYAIRPNIGGPPILTATVDPERQEITFTPAAGESWTVDVTTARAAWVVIQDALYDGHALDLDGPLFTVEIDRGRGKRKVIDTGAAGH